MSVRTEAGVSGHHVGRYILEDLVTEHAGTSLWRATDPALQRAVGLRLMPLVDDRVADLRAAALAAARVHDRRLVNVLDVVETDEALGVVTEWVNGHSWSELLYERWSPHEAAVVAVETGRALESAHTAGVTHGRIRPDSVMITDTREVRLRGLGVDAALWGSSTGEDPRREDLHGVGALLYAGLTRHWPPTPGATSMESTMPPAPMVAGHVQLPSALVPEIPAALDRVVSRSLLSVRPPAGGRYATVGEAVRDLERAVSRVPVDDAAQEYAEDTASATDRLLGRLGTLAVIGLAVAGLALLVWQLWVNRPAADQARADSSAAPVIPDPSTAPPAPMANEAPFGIVGARAYDPEGDGEENPETVAGALDNDETSAWMTGDYSSADMAPKSGVGLLVDLGAIRPVRAIRLQLIGTGTDFEVYTTRTKPRQLSGFRKVVDITGSGESIMVRTARPTNARFVLVWLTRLPFDGAFYSGGITKVRVVG